MRVLICVVAALALASCATQDTKGDALEAKAKAGDPVAACQLAVHDLQRCAAIRDDWISSGRATMRMHPATRSPNCMDDAVPEEHERYLAASVGKLKGPRQSLASETVKHIAVMEIFIRYHQSDDRAVLNAIESSCSRLADDA